MHEPFVVGIGRRRVGESVRATDNSYVVTARDEPRRDIEARQLVAPGMVGWIPGGEGQDPGHGAKARRRSENQRHWFASLPYGTVKVAITHPYSWPEVRRGAERILAETAGALAARGHTVTVFTSGTAAARDQDNVQTVRYRRRFTDPVRHERWFGWRVFPALLRGGFEVVHSLMPYDALASIHASRVTRHLSVYEEIGNPFRWWWNGLPDRRARRRVVRAADVYGCMSQYTLGVLATEWGRAGVVIPGGVRLQEFAPAPQRAPEPTILFSGALDEPRKHLSTVLEAVDRLATNVPEVQLWLSGPGDAAPVLAAASPRARARTTVLPLGDPQEQGDRYGTAWVTALPSEGDCFGLVLVESLACGTPIVVADDGAPPELVTPETGAVSRLGDPASLAESLATALDLAREPDTVRHCRSRAAAFDWHSAVAPMLENIYDEGLRATAFDSGSTPAA
jgi:phosphatidylinositol alpha-mannosyltransferase